MPTFVFPETPNAELRTPSAELGTSEFDVELPAREGFRSWTACSRRLSELGVGCFLKVLPKTSPDIWRAY
jgi:hypothetical protein